MNNEVNFISHCYDCDCGLGYATYVCPSCKSTIEDYGDLWFEYSDYRNGKIWDNNRMEIKCKECNKDLIVFFDEEEWIWRIK